MDLELVMYNHTRHYHLFWPIFSKFWKEVNGKNLEKLRTIYVEGKPFVTNALEDKLMAVQADGKRIKIVVLDGDPIGFIQYQRVEGDVLFVDSIYIEKEYRYIGVTKFLINSFPETLKWLFQVHKSLRPDMMLKGILSAKKISDAKEEDLELWEAWYDPESQGQREVVVALKEQLRKE